MIFTLTYLSTMREAVTRAELEAMLERSRIRNAELGITGLLLYRKGRIMQVLEGEEPTVRELFDRIRHDSRHRDVVAHWAGLAPERRFPDWTMGLEVLPAVEPEPAGVGDTDVPAADRPVAAASPGSATATEPQASDLFVPQLSVATLTAEQERFIDRRTQVLRRALVNGHRATTALAVILNAHEPESALADDGRISLRCRECRVHDHPLVDGYPCSTAQNAFWALDATV